MVFPLMVPPPEAVLSCTLTGADWADMVTVNATVTLAVPAIVRVLNVSLVFDFVPLPV